MKKNAVLSNATLLISGLLVLSSTFIMSCSNEVEGTTDPMEITGEMVKTQFSISVPYTKKVQSRMIDSNTQTNGNFLGMQDMKLIPFALAIPSTGIIGSSVMDRGLVIDLPQTGSLDQMSNSAKVYTDVEIETGTSNFLLYAQATHGTDKFAQGSLLPANMPKKGQWRGKVSDISFSLEPTNTLTLVHAVPLAFQNYLNVINLADWKRAAAGTNLNGDALELKTLHAKFIKLKAGSANGIKKTAEELYSVLSGLTASTAIAFDATTVGAVATAIRAAILEGGNSGIKFEATETSLGSGLFVLNFASTVALPTQNFPLSFNLPEGSVQVTYNSNSGFAYANGNYGDGSIASLSHYVYPAAMWYTANSTIKCATSSQIDNFTGSNDDTGWNNLLGQYTAGDRVSTATRSIAMVNRIKYGVARLQSKVYFASAQVEDNRLDNNGNQAPSSVTIPTEGFPITAIIVGGQKNVDWKFNPTTEAGATQYTVYDQNMNIGFTAKYALDATSLSSNSTLLLETDEESINIAIEMRNNTGRTFYGINGGAIYDGQKFYMLGKLNKAEGGNASNNGGATKVFQQAFVTMANFKITSLKSAYNTLPDLRTTQLELGLSVDLSWKAGYSFDVTIE